MRSIFFGAVLAAAFAWPTAAFAAPQVTDFENTTVATGFFSTFQQDGFNYVLTGGAPPTWTTHFGAPLVGTGIRAFSGGGGDAQQGTITRIGGGTFTMTSLIVVNYSNTTALTVRAFNGASQVFTTSIAANGSATVNFGNVLATEVRLNGNSANAGGNFGTTFGFDNFTIDVPNVAPTLANIEGNQVGYNQGGSPSVLDTGTALTVSDADSTDFNGGTFTLSIFAGGVGAEDVLEVGAVGPITLSGVDVVHSGTTIGSITSSGVGGNPLTIALNANATPARVQDLGRAFRYDNTNGSSPGVNLRRILWSLTDGDGAPPRSYRSSVKVFPLIAGGSVVRVEFSGATAPNPTFGFPKVFTAGGFTFRTGDQNNATSCDVGCFTSDLDAPNSPGAQILATGLTGLTTTIRRSDNSTFTLVSLVVGNKSSANVTVTARNGGSVLDTRVLAGGAAQQLSFPNLTVDEVRVTGSTTITGNLVQGWIDDLVVAVANVPAAINNLGGNTATYTQLGAAVTLDTGTAATVVDPDSANFDTGSLSASITGNLWAGQDVLGVGNIGTITTSGANVLDSGTQFGTITANGSGGNPLTITFNANATLARVQNLVRALTYSNSNTNTTTGVQGPDLGNRTVQVLINDGDGAPPGSVSTTVQVRPAPLPGNNQVEVNFNGLSVVGTPNTLAFQNHTFTVTGGSQPYLSGGFLTPSGPSLRAGATEIVNQTFTIRRTDNASFLLASLIVANLSQESARTVRSFNGASTVQTVSLPAGATQRIVFNNSAVTRIEISGSTGLTTAALAEVDDLAIFLPFPNLTINNVTLTEGNSGSTNASFTVSLSGPAPAGGTQFDIATANGTATGGSDFTTTTLTGQTIPEGSSSYTFNVPVLGDNVVEANETFLVNVTNVLRAIVVDGQGQGTINNDDVAGISVVQSGGNTAVAEGGATDTYTVVLTSEPTANVSIALTGSQVLATPTPLVFTAGNWNTPQTVTVTAIDDFVAEGNHAGSVTSAVTSSDPTYNGFAVAAVPVAIADNDNAGITVVQSGGTTVVAEGGASDSYTVVLTSQPTANVSIVLTGTQVTALPSPLVFTAGDWNTPKTVTVTAIDDFVAEGNHNGSVAHAVTSADGNYNAFGIAAISVPISDNDTAGITLVQSGGNTAVTEGGATDSYTLVLTSQPVANVSIALTTTQVGAAPAPVVFTAADWNTPKTVTVTATDDFIAEGNHSGSVAHAVTSADGNYHGFAVATVSVSITDNDTPGVTVVQTGGNTAVAEGGATDSYTLVLTSQPTEDVTITPTGTQVGVAPASRTFTAATWNVPQSFTVTAVDDGIVEGTHTGSITHAVASADPNYGGLAIGGVPGITITDNDSAIVQFAPAAVSQSEGSSPMAFTVTLSNPVQSGVTLAVNSAPGTATAADFTAISAGSVVFPANSTAAQTVNVSINGDALDEDDEQFTLTLSGLTATGNVSLGTATATGTILDDDELPVLSVANVSQDEGDALNTLVFTVNLNPVSGRAVSFTRATQDGTAVSTPPTPDFVALAAAPITIPAGQTSVTIPVTINGDTVYEGDQSFSLALTAVVNATPGSLAATATLVDDDQQPTTTAITADAPDPSVVGQGYLVSATVTAQATSPLGSVTIGDGSGGSCSAPLVPGTPPASSMSCTLASSSAGAKTLSADYSPASTAFAPSSGSGTHQVNPAATTISVSGPARSRINQPTAFGFALAVSAPGAGTPTGTVTLSSGASSCTATLPATSCNLSFGTLGTRTVSASYAGDGNFLASASSGSGNAPTLVYALSDIAVSKSDGLATYEPGDLVVYSVLVRNLGPDAAAAIRVRDEVPAGLAGVVWSCDASGGALCPVAGGSGNLDVLVATLPSGGVLGFTFYGTVGSAPQIANTAAVELPADTTIEDPLLANNSATDISLLEYLFRNGYEAPAVAAPDGSLVMPGAALRGVLDEVALAVYTLDDAGGIAARVYARVWDGELQYALASRDVRGVLRLGAWRSHPADPSLRWTALPEQDGWRVASVELR